MKYVKTKEHLTFVYDGKSYNIQKQNNNFEDILNCLQTDDEERLLALIDIFQYIKKKSSFDFDDETETLSYRSINLGVEAKTRVIQFASKGLELECLENFLVKLRKNRERKQKEHLEANICGRGFSLTYQGNLVAYTQMAKESAGDIGSIVKRDRGKINSDINLQCNYGIEVFYSAYTSTSIFQNPIYYQVLVDPRDIVAGYATSSKLRVSRVFVLNEFKELPERGYIKPVSLISNCKKEDLPLSVQMKIADNLVDHIFVNM